MLFPRFQCVLNKFQFIYSNQKITKKRERWGQNERERKRMYRTSRLLFLLLKTKHIFSLLNFHWNETDVSISVLPLTCKNDYPQFHFGWVMPFHSLLCEQHKCSPPPKLTFLKIRVEKPSICCVFRPAFGCCAHPKDGRTIFFSCFQPFLFISNLFQWFQGWNQSSLISFCVRAALKSWS